MKNKTIAVYLALLLGVLGAHRFYLKGLRDLWAWLQALVSTVGALGIMRGFAMGQDDRVTWVLAPWFGVSLFAACLCAIVYGLSSQQTWNAVHQPQADPEHRAGATSGITVFGVILALLLGATSLMSAIAFAGQRYFEYVSAA